MLALTRGLLALALLLGLASPAEAQLVAAPVYRGAIATNPDGLNPAWYMERYPDVAAYYALQHWKAYGKKEGRQPFKPASIIGINLPGYEANSGSTRPFGYDYILPRPEEVAAMVAKGMPLIRLPVSWERMQPMAMGPLNPAEVKRLQDWLDVTNAAGGRVIIDLHAYGRYRGVVASPAALADFWSRLAVALKGKAAGYGLMNEPHDMGDPKLWPVMAQAAVDAIRKVDTATRIYVGADGWSGIHQPIVKVSDPSNLISYEGHLYLDVGNSGVYGVGWAPKTAATISAQVQDFATRARAAGGEPFIGEFGGPSDPASLALLDTAVAAMAANSVPGSYWCGNGWGDTKLAAYLNGAEQPQMSVLVKAR